MTKPEISLGKRFISSLQLSLYESFYFFLIQLVLETETQKTIKDGLVKSITGGLAVNDMIVLYQKA